MARKLGDLGLQDRMPRPDVVVPGNLECSDEIPQPVRHPLLDRTGSKREQIDYPKPRGATPSGFPTPTRPDNPNNAPDE